MSDEQTKLDPKIEETLKGILAKDLNDLTANDKAFIRARKDYIGRESRKRLRGVFDEKVEPVEEVDEVEETPADVSEHPADTEAKKAEEAIATPDEDELEEDDEDDDEKK